MQRLALMAALLLVLVAPAGGKEHSGARTAGDAAVTRPGPDHNRGSIFSSAERSLIRSWLLEAERREAAAQSPAGFPTGLQQQAARGKPLPPGGQKQLVRGKRLDDDSYSRGVLLPPELLRQLPPPPPGSELLRIGDRVVRLDAATRTVLDVFALGGGS